jgi:hypothetical protein
LFLHLPYACLAPRGRSVLRAMRQPLLSFEDLKRGLPWCEGNNTRIFT